MEIVHLKVQCPMLQQCLDASKIDCTDRDFVNCNFFRQCLTAYCDLKVHNKCGVCKYHCFCNLKERKRRL
jgi:hypothetical protein